MAKKSCDVDADERRRVTGALRMDLETVREEVEHFETLGEVIRWAMARTPRAEFVNLVVQDEYTHDLIVRVDPYVYAVFDSTWLGAVMAVAIWDHEPTAEELLSRRVAQGWCPTPTATSSGDEVLGFAACLRRPARRTRSGLRPAWLRVYARN